MNLHPLLAEAKNPDGSARFYPPGEHPATYRYRRHLMLLESLPGERSRETQALIDDVLDTLGAFEEGESVAKAIHLQAVRGHV